MPMAERDREMVKQRGSEGEPETETDLQREGERQRERGVEIRQCKDTSKASWREAGWLLERVLMGQDWVEGRGKPQAGTQVGNRAAVRMASPAGSGRHGGAGPQPGQGWPSASSGHRGSSCWHRPALWGRGHVGCERLNKEAL